MLRPSPLIISLTLVAPLGVTPARAAGGGIAWRNWSETAFAQGRRSLPVFTPGDLDAVAARPGGAAGPTRASPR
jgi:hypothetical protein